MGGNAGVVLDQIEEIEDEIELGVAGCDGAET